MTKLLKFTTVAGLGLAAAVLMNSVAFAGDGGANTGDDLRSLRTLVQEQRLQIEEQERALKAQGRRLEALEAQFIAPVLDPRVRTVAAPGGPPKFLRRRDYSLVQDDQDRVGEAPDERRPQVAIVQQNSGVLTPAGRVVFEPSITFSHTDVNRFVVGGVAILDTVLIGVFEVTSADRDTITSSFGGRLGISDRIEIEASVPYIARNDTTTNTVVSGGGAAAQTSLRSDGLGDIEFAGHFQLSSGGGGLPFLVGNLRVKTTTGEGPFDVKRNSAGTEQELPLGSGFWAIEPSLTFLLPSDPVVFFGNIGYLFNIASDINKTVGTVLIGRVDPGDAVRVGFGMGTALNERVSLSLGYQHDFIAETKTVADNVKNDSERLSVGTLSFGVNFQVREDVAVNVGVAVGVTEDAPDVGISLRVPTSFQLRN